MQSSYIAFENGNGAAAGEPARLGQCNRCTHFVIDTSRNGEGPNPMTGGSDADMLNYTAAPFDQPANVISTLQSGNWCNPPGSGLGLAPTATRRPGRTQRRTELPGQLSRQFSLRGRGQL